MTEIPKKVENFQKFSFNGIQKLDEKTKENYRNIFLPHLLFFSKSFFFKVGIRSK